MVLGTDRPSWENWGGRSKPEHTALSERQSEMQPWKQPQVTPHAAMQPCLSPSQLTRGGRSTHSSVSGQACPQIASQAASALTATARHTAMERVTSSFIMMVRLSSVQEETEGTGSNPCRGRGGC